MDLGSDPLSEVCIRESGSATQCHGPPNAASELTDQDSDPATAIFISDHKNGITIFFLSTFFCLLLFMLHLHIFFRIKSHKEVTKL